MKGKPEITPGLVCVYESAPDHHQERTSESVVDRTRHQLEDVITAQLNDREALDSMTRQLYDAADTLRVAECAEAYSSLCSTNMKQADEYIRERPSLVEGFDKARFRIISAVYSQNLPAKPEEHTVNEPISRGFEEVSGVIEETALDDNDNERAQILHLRMLQELNERYAPVDGHAPTPSILLRQVLRVEEGLRFVSDVDIYKDAIECVTQVRRHWGFKDERTTRETSMAVHPSSQHNPPKVIKIASGHDWIEHEPPGDDKAKRSAQALSRLPKHIRALEPKKRYF